ncbi:bifunctional biotin--[acetyl-CoA-carboxylase] ligase/biotin operon repressor BirA [Plesiomonas shigelloides]|uniref:bifunctional biotin--[acetyl-CoA-carboxylase] ligase/biotin operon repressor BirA n=1 Tax=Plesiomonas shigelloides TaxID=703 RepID=UPI0012625B0B|nr:bifunctional biotin--[acetyl-CoA-carboxylase] ligase/biotin operon repressor BirA [Plesiomonas shigelloides]KAB7666107.1 bifunctional biotin--[acetyl-CoA-carboxylase] ligase/biotin operon repressor BirA [Plesiomonas shigelloides]
MKNSETPLQIVRWLADGEFRSGERLGEWLGISRAAVSKHIRTLQSWGIDVFTVPGKGYRLAEPMELLTTERLQALAPEAQFALLPVIDSTNQYLLDRIGQYPSGYACLAEYQHAGRGRRGRVWQSPFGANLYLSMYWRLEQGPAAAVGLSLAIGVIVADVLTSLGVGDVKVKWPNDLYLNDKKLSGILVELTGQTGDAAHIVLGMGINVALPASVREQIDQPCACVKDVCPELSRNQLAAALLQALQQQLPRYEQAGLGAFYERWNELDNFAGRQVRLLMGERCVEGVACGIDSHGALRLRLADGTLKSFIGGEISLRPVTAAQ